MTKVVFDQLGVVKKKKGVEYCPQCNVEWQGAASSCSQCGFMWPNPPLKTCCICKGAWPTYGINDEWYCSQCAPADVTNRTPNTMEDPYADLY